MFDYGIARAGFVRVVTDPDALTEMLPTRWATIQHYGVTFDNVGYDGDAFDPTPAHAGFRNRKSPWSAGSGRWRFKVDPRDLSAVHFWRPDDPDDGDGPGRWERVQRKGPKGHMPFTDKDLAYAKRLIVARHDYPERMTRAVLDRVRLSYLADGACT